MPSFDIVSQVDTHELQNAIDQANREITTRFDFKGIEAKYEFNHSEVTLTAPNEFQIKQMQDILRNKIAKRNIDTRCLVEGKINAALHEAKQINTIKQGIGRDEAKKITKLIKDTKLKVQASVQGDQVRVTGKKRDDLQTVIETLKECPLDMPLQYINFRD